MSLSSAEQDQGTGEQLNTLTGQTPASRAVQQVVQQGAYSPVAVLGGGKLSTTCKQ